MKKLDLIFFESLEDAYRDGSAASCKWADNRIKEIQEYLNKNNELEIIEDDKSIRIKSVEMLVAWKKNKNFPRSSFTIKVNHIDLINSLNKKIQKNNTAEIQISQSTNSSSNTLDLNFIADTSDKKLFNSKFKDVTFSSLKQKNSIYFSRLRFRLAYSDELDLLKKITEIKGFLAIAVEYVNSNGENVDFIVCKKIEI